MDEQDNIEYWERRVEQIKRDLEVAQAQVRHWKLRLRRRRSRTKVA